MFLLRLYQNQLSVDLVFCQEKGQLKLEFFHEWSYITVFPRNHGVTSYWKTMKSGSIIECVDIFKY